MFEKKYFDDLYFKGSDIDGDINSKEHANYIHSLFLLMEIEVESLVDFGCGKSNLLQAVSKKLEAKYIEACDVSHYALSELKKKKWAKNIIIKHTAIHKFKSKRTFDLGLCNSVLQYIKTEDLEASLYTMAKTCRYLYFHIPTKEDYKVLKSSLHFSDPYAYSRENSFYRSLVEKYFTTVSYGLLESKLHPKQLSPFIDSFYRF